VARRTNNPQAILFQNPLSSSKSPAGACVPRVPDEPGCHIHTTQNSLVFYIW
jgi:hypothetical protein